MADLPINMHLLDDSTEDDEFEIQEYDPVLDANLNLLMDFFDEDVKKRLSLDKNLAQNAPIRSKILVAYVNKFYEQNQEILEDKTELERELFVLNQTTRALSLYGTHILGLGKQYFRQKIYFPNIVYILVRLLPTARTFIQKVIRACYNSIRKNHSSLINLYENSIYTDKEQIISEIMFCFLGSSIRDIKVLGITNLWAFFRSIFNNHFRYFFMSEQKIHSSWINYWNVDEQLENEKYSIPTRENIYRDCLIELQLRLYRRHSSLFRQLDYNYEIFKKAITSNELQTMYFAAVKSISPEVFDKTNNQYKLMTFYNHILNDDGSNELLNQIKKLPIIFKMLKSVRLVRKKSAASVIHGVHPEMIKSAVVEELIYPFRNILRADGNVHPVLQQVSENFVESVLGGEYLSLISLTTVKTDQYSFVQQLIEFVKICIKHVAPKEKHHFLVVGTK